MELVKLPNPELDKSLKITDFDFRLSTLNWVQQSPSELIKAVDWLNPTFRIPEENSSSCTEAQKHALIALIVALVLFVAVTVASLVYYYNRIYDKSQLREESKKKKMKSQQEQRDTKLDESIDRIAESQTSKFNKDDDTEIRKRAIDPLYTPILPSDLRGTSKLEKVTQERVLVQNTSQDYNFDQDFSNVTISNNDVSNFGINDSRF